MTESILPKEADGPEEPDGLSDCLVVRWAVAIAVEVLQRFELDECDRADVSALKDMLGTDMRTPGNPSFAFSDKALVDLREEAREIVDALARQKG
jgi:hypothetical protein